MRTRVLTAVLGTCAALAVAAAPPASASSNAAATHAYVQANSVLVKVARGKLATLEDQPRKVLARLKHECPGAAEGSPQNDESTQMSNEIIGAIVISAGKLIRPHVLRFVTAARSLHCSNPAIERPIRAYVANLAPLSKLEVPPLCTDTRAWAAG